MQVPRRRLLAWCATAAAAGSMAGCSAPTDQAAPDGTDTPGSSPTAVGDGGTGASGTPGADVLGGPDDLRSSATVDATVLEQDAGAGRFVNTPAVVWVSAGSTVTWTIEGGAHSVTAYHPENDRPRRVPEGAASFDSGVLDAGETFEHTFETPGVFNYLCRPHEGLGMVGVVVVEGPRGGPGATRPEDVETAAAADALARLLGDIAGLLDAADARASYGWEAATFDAYWYSLYNMSTNIAMSGNGVTFPATDEQRQVFEERLPAMLEAADQQKPPIANPNLNLAPFTGGDPRFTQRPVFDVGDGRPDAETLTWDPAESSGVVSPASLAWTHLKGVTWAKNFENHFDVLPDSLAAEFRAQLLSTLAQLGTKFALVDGNLRANDENLLLVSGLDPTSGVVDERPRPRQHAAMLWFVSDLVSLATGGWFGYEHPRPLVPPENLQQLADGLGRTVMKAFEPAGVVDAGSTRDLGLFLAAMGWYGTHAGSDDLAGSAAGYANALADAVAERTDGNGRVGGAGANQAATQGLVGQGLLWASRVDGVDRADLADDVLGYLLDALWDDDAGTFASGEDASTYAITARDAGDVTGGLNAAEAVLGRSDVRETFARFFDETFNRGRLQRAERPPSRDPDADHPLPLPPAAGGEHGQAAVYNAAVEYDVEADAWTVVDDRFDTEGALYLANQDIWVGQWGGRFFQGRGVPGESDGPT